ncbi:hypothetical protein [Pseudorhodoferax sp.]
MHLMAASLSDLAAAVVSLTATRPALRGSRKAARDEALQEVAP